MSIYKRLLGYVGQYKYRLIFGIFLSFLVSVFNGASLTTLIPIFDSLGSGENYKFQFTITKKDQANLLKWKNSEPMARLQEWETYISRTKLQLNEKFASMTTDELVFLFCMIVFPIYLAKLICLAGTVYFINSAGLLAVRDIRHDLYKKMQLLPMNYFVQEKTGILMSRIINDVETMGKIISIDMKDAINDFFYIITHLLILFFLSWKLTLIVFFVIPILMGPVGLLADKIRRATKNQQERLSSLNGDLQEVISGIRVIRAFSREDVESKRFFQVNDDLNKKTFRGHFYHQVGPTITDFAGALLTVIFLGIGAYLMEENGFSRGVFLAFFITLIFLMRPLKQMSILVNLAQASLAAGGRVFDIMDEKIDIVEVKNPKKIDRLQDSIEFRDVYYHYPNAEQPALRGLNLKIRKEETIALVGQSGAGKSTLVDLIPRLIDPGSGQILMDGIDLRELDIHNLRKRIGIVSQNVFLFNGTIRENIMYGSMDASESQLKDACDKAFATEFIEAFEQGFDTIVGERGVMLSGGQKQRISIARALLLDPEILILDEATSALDTESERLIQVAFQTLYKNRTVIIIAHRLSTVKIANTIYYMENGQILESGSHDSLLEQDSYYKKLYELEFANQATGNLNPQL
ncbi:ABC transporter ATP-binding protein [Leptospira sp. GIMC2001]|uniref:ABC transporter ATP-binding protein n=1 Tax=Leptospira sp. GIMC2001 TaxID=1513297 RepID=UPI00234B0EAF|nr:ABC transporter ATP-binding protein [Leptospira sp. GIMC2001]WCL50396.1 ABC transporter ATP-binding protein [Leptospira sp. GIMC2001]